MAKPKWWVCDGCHSLNDLPANKCYNCRAEKPESPRLMDDHYSEVVSHKRVGITVDLSKVGDLTRPDPIETQQGGGIFEAFGDQREQAAEAPGAGSGARQPYDPYAPATGSPASPPRPAPPPLREPQRRGIDQLGGYRQWAEPPMASPEPAAPPPPTPGPQTTPGPPLPPSQAPPTPVTEPEEQG